MNIPFRPAVSTFCTSSLYFFPSCHWHGAGGSWGGQKGAATLKFCNIVKAVFKIWFHTWFMKSFPWNRHDPYLVQMPCSKLSYFSENLQDESFLTDLESERCFAASIIWILSLLVYTSVFLLISVLKTHCICSPSGCCPLSFFLANILENVLA